VTPNLTETAWYVDLTARRTWCEVEERDAFAPVIGGSGRGWQILADRLPERIDPFDPANRLVLNPGLFVGTRTIGSPKLTAITKFPTIASPDRRFFTGSCTGGGRYFAIGMRQAGCDRLVVSGKADAPVIIDVRDGGVFVQDAS
jgi:aldehyde:ferredoxin oxidoreductase